MASFLDVFSVVDSDGVSASRYRLNFSGNILTSPVFGTLTELVYGIYQLLAIPANALLGLVLDSGSWLDPLGRFYQKVTGPLYAVFPPWAIACLGLGVVAVSLMMSRPASTSIFGSEALNRIGAAVGMAAAVLVLTNNPFAMLSKVLELANGFAGGLAAAVSGSNPDTVLTSGQAMVNATLRTPTIMLNYGREMGAQCQSLWSQAMLTPNPLPVSSGCFAAGDDAASAATLTTALAMLIPAVLLILFCVVAAWKYLLHLTMSAVCLLATGWVAAASIHRRRGFDQLAKAFAHAAAHLVVAVVVSMLAVALPAACAGLAVQLLGLVGNPTAAVFGELVGLSLGFGVTAWAIVKVTSSRSVLVLALQADARSNLESLIGIDPKKAASSRISNTRTLFGGPAPAAGPGKGGAKSPVRKSVLAADPVAATAGAQPPTGGGPLNAAASAVAGLAAAVVAPVVSGTMSAGAPNAPKVIVTASPKSPRPGRARGAATAAAATAAGMVAPTAAAALGVAGSSVGKAVTVAAAAAGAGPVVAAVAGAAASTAAATKSTPRVDTAEPPLLAHPAPSATGTTVEARPSVLASPPRVTPFGVGETPGVTPRPVVGNSFADPDLDVAARTAGATFVAGPAPRLQRMLPQWVRRFLPDRVSDSPPAGAVPEVEYAAPLAIITHSDAVMSDPTGSPGPVVDSLELNDQQRWNKKRPVRGMPDREDVTSSLPGGAAEAPALQPGANPHPQGHCAAWGDFLESDQLESDINEVTAVLGAAGQQVEIRIDPSDSRVGLQLSRDPEERVRPAAAPGFGDPA